MITFLKEDSERQARRDDMFLTLMTNMMTNQQQQQPFDNASQFTNQQNRQPFYNAPQSTTNNQFLQLPPQLPPTHTQQRHGSDNKSRDYLDFLHGFNHDNDS